MYKLRELLNSKTVLVALMALGFLSYVAALGTQHWLFHDGTQGGPTVFMTQRFFLFVLLLTALGLAFLLQTRVRKLETELFDRGALELGLQQRALDAHSIVCVTDPNGILLSVNDKFIDAFGYARQDKQTSRDEFIGRSVSILYRDGFDDATFQEIGACLKKGDVWSGESREWTAEGVRLIMQCTIVPLHDSRGRHIKTVAIRTDVTQARKAEESRFFKALLDHLQDEVYIFDAETLQMRYANLGAIERCKWDAATLKDCRITDSHPKFNESAFKAHVAPLFSGRRDSVSIELEHDLGAVEINTRLYTGEDGQRLFVSVLRDAAERKKVERAKMETVSIVSHELRTPITSIKGALRLLDSGALGEMSEKAKPILEIAHRNSERLLMVVNDILDLEKMRAGKMSFNPKQLDLVTLVKDAVDMNKGYGDIHDVSFAFESDLSEAPAYAAPDRLMQVLANLMSNAAKFSPKDGTVRVSVEDKGKDWRISVADDGPGIPEESRKSVFESFSQLASHDGKERNGTGLGLTISQKIVRAHGGKIDFDSVVGKGTTFYVELPKKSKLAMANDPAIAAE